MKSQSEHRIVIKGVLSAAMVVACLNARSQQVYSINCVSFVNSEMASEASVLWSGGPFTVGESHYWTDAEGNKLTGPHNTDSPVRSSTYFAIGSKVVTVPLSPRRTFFVGATALLILAALSGIRPKKRRASASGA